MNTCYFCCTLFIIGMFVGFFIDMYIMYKKEISKEEGRIKSCKDDYKNNYCYMGNGGPPLLRDKCKELKQCMGRTAKNEVTGSRIMANYTSQFFNDFSANLEVKAIAVMALICYICVCGFQCCKGLSNMADDPHKYLSKGKSKSSRDDSSSSDEERRRRKKKKDKKKRKEKYQYSDSSDEKE